MTAPRKSHPLNVPLRLCSQKNQPGDTCLSALDLSSTDYAILMAARYFFASFARPDDHSWMTVILSCQDFFPAQRDSLLVAQSVLALVHEIRISRKSTLRFSNPHCLDCANVITAEERHLMSMINAHREGRVSSAATHAILLCEGNGINRVLNSVAQVISLHRDAEPTSQP